MQVLRAAGHRRMPWRNGGGVTTEIAVFPEAAGLDDFEWRLSMASVASDGPFSSFWGVDRTLAVLEGEGIVLSVEGQAGARMTPASPPLAFAADQPASARLIAGPITDLNAMTRRGLWTHRMERLVVRGSSTIADSGRLTIVFCASGSPTISDGKETLTLAQQDAAIVDGVQVDAASGAAELYIVRFDPII